MNTEILIIIVAAAIIWAVVSSITSSIKQKQYERRMIETLSPALEKGLSEIELLPFEDIRAKIQIIKDFFEENKVILRTENNEEINICPKCGDTLAVKTVNWYGRILGCPNYPRCHYLKKVEDIRYGIFDNLHF